MASASDRLTELGLELPPVAAPVAAYVPALRVGDLVYSSGQLPSVAGQLVATGKVGAEVSAKTGASCARTAVLNALAAVSEQADGVEEHHEGLRRTRVVGQGGAHGLRVGHRARQLGHVQVEMELLRDVVVRPGRRAVVQGELERHLRPGLGADAPPVLFPADDRPAQQGGVELGQPRWVVGVQDDVAEGDARPR